MFSTIPQRIIWWWPPGSLGDTLLALAFFEAVHQSNPHAHYILVTRHNASRLREISAAAPNVSVCDLSHGSGKKLLRLWLGRSLFIIPPHFGSVPRKWKIIAYIFSLRPGSIVFGFRDTEKWQPYDTVLDFDYMGKTYYQNILTLLPQMHIPISEDSFPKAALPSKEPVSLSLPTSYIVIHPFASNPGRSLPLERWRMLLPVLRQLFPSYTLVLTGAGRETADAQKLAENMEGVMVAANLPMAQLVWVVQHSALYLGPDTGVMHLASVLRKKSVVIGTLSNPALLPLYNPNAQILIAAQRCTCRGAKGDDGCKIMENGVAYFRCVYDLSQEDILAAVTRSLSARFPEDAAALSPREFMRRVRAGEPVFQ